MIEQLIDLLWMAVTAMPFAIGFSGGGSSQQASPPKLDVAGSLRLSQGQIDQLVKNAPQLARVLGDTALREQSQNTLYGLGMLTNPAGTLGKSLRDEAGQDRRKKLGDLNKRLSSGKIKQADFDKQKRTIDAAYNKAVASSKKINPLGDLQKTFKNEFAQRDNLISSMRGSLASTDEYSRMQDSFGRGVTAQQTAAGQLGERLMQEAMAKMDQGGQLSPEAARDATQSARSGMAARGMATGNAGLAAELLNRDRYSREREFQNLGFARSVQSEDLGRRQTNAAMRADTDRFNIGLLGTSAQAADAERARRLGTRQDIYNFSLASNPRMMLAGLGSPYANLTQPAFDRLGAITGSVQPQYSGGQFSSGGLAGGLMGGAMGAAGGALTGAALGTTIFPGYGTALGAGLGALGGLTGFMGGSR
jgi:hypothetical protein